MKLDVKAMALTIGLLWAAAMFLTGVANLIWDGYAGHYRDNDLDSQELLLLRGLLVFQLFKHAHCPPAIPPSRDTPNHEGGKPGRRLLPGSGRSRRYVPNSKHNPGQNQTHAILSPSEGGQ